jgi:peptidoglycan/xylan/chitin deacetylase (PgdA/CDA1 family)
MKEPSHHTPSDLPLTDDGGTPATEAAIPKRRWVAKKAARRGVAYGSWASGLLSMRKLYDRVLEPGPRVRALTYHRFGRAVRDPFCVTAEAFEAQVRYLAERRLAVSLDDVCAFVAGLRTVPDGAVLVTIDDGCLSTLRWAAPILARHGVPAVAYVTPALVGAGKPDVLPERFLTWEELAELPGYGVELGAHGYTHRSMGQLPPEEIWNEAHRSRETFRERLDLDVRSFAYPFGTFGDFSETTERALADAGYEVAFNSQHGSIRRGMDPISLPRVKVEGGEDLRMFGLACRGAMDPWRIVDGRLWRLQRLRSELG